MIYNCWKNILNFNILNRISDRLNAREITSKKRKKHDRQNRRKEPEPPKRSKANTRRWNKKEKE